MLPQPQARLRLLIMGRPLAGRLLPVALPQQAMVQRLMEQLPQVELPVLGPALPVLVPVAMAVEPVQPIAAPLMHLFRLVRLVTHR